MDLIGVDDRLFQKHKADIRKRERFIFLVIHYMIIIASLIAFSSIWIYIIQLFGGWLWVSFLFSLVFALIFFNLYRMLLVTSINAYHTVLGEYEENHFLAYDHIKDIESKLYSDLLEIVYKKKLELRKRGDQKNSFIHSNAQFATFALKFMIILFFSVLFAMGIELYIYQDHLNESLAKIKEIYKDQPGSWIYSVILDEQSEDSQIIRSSSILFIMEVLNIALGYWKYLIDIMVAIIFLLPLVLVYRSREIIHSVYVREKFLEEFTISYLHHLETLKSAREFKGSLEKSGVNV